MTAWRDEPDDQMIGSSVSQPMALTYTSFRRPSMSFESKIVCFLFMVHIRFRFCTTEMCCGRFRLKHVISAPRVKSTETIWSHNGPVEIMQSLRNTRVLLTRNDPGETKVSNVSDSHTQTHLQLYSYRDLARVAEWRWIGGSASVSPEYLRILTSLYKKVH